MKKIIFTILITFIIIANIFAQAPQAFKYQTVVRDNSGNSIAGQLVSFRLGIIQDSINGVLVYSETHSITTTQLGLAMLEIGTGTIETGVFENINWGTASHFLKLELDLTNGTNYHLMGISQLLSVPYALHAKSAEEIDDADADPTNEYQFFSTSGDTLFISNDNYVILPGVSPFFCGQPITDIDGNTYNTVLIGTQCWMAENLKTTTYNNGTPITNVTDNTTWSNLTTGAYVWYNNAISWKDLYGALYNWYAISDPNGLCPVGWHVPGQDEWTVLTDFIGGTASPHGNKLKSCRQVNSPLGGGCNTTAHPRWNENSSGWGTDDYGFSGLPGGYRNFYGTFEFIGSHGFWWSSTEDWFLYLVYGTGSIYVFDDDNKRYGFSVRCLQD